MRDPKPTSWHFARPQLAVHHLRAFDLGLISATALHAKRRMGKLGRPADRSVPQNALKRLRERQILIQSDIGVYRFEDEAFKDWVTLTMNSESSKSPL